MAWVASDGFDLYNGTGANVGLLTKWTLTGPITMQTGRFGGQCMQLSGVSGGSGNTQATRSLTASRTSGTNGVAFRFTQFQTDNRAINTFSLMQSGTYQFGVYVTAAGALQVYRLSGYGTGTLLGNTANGLVSLNTWSYLEIVWTCSSTVGAVQLYLDGASVLTLTGVNNQNAGSASCDSFRAEVFLGSQPILQVDDYVEGDAATAIGPMRVETIRPASNSSVTWTPLTGANYSQVNETLCDGDTSYVQATTVGNRDLYTFAALSSTPALIPGITAISFADKNDATLRQVYNSLHSGSTDSDGPAFTLSSAYAKFERGVATDPNTGVAWTPSGVAALTAGPKLAA